MREDLDVYPVVIEGERIVLREFTPDDAADVYRWVGDFEAVAHVPLGPLDRPATVRYLSQLISNSEAKPRLSYPLGIERRSDRALVGSIDVEIDSMEHKRAEVGFIVRREEWGLGYASEALALARDFVFDHLGVVRLWAVCDPENLASAAVLRRCGMSFEGLLRGDLDVRGERRDSMMFAVLESDRSARPDDYL